MAASAETATERTKSPISFQVNKAVVSDRSGPDIGERTLALSWRLALLLLPLIAFMPVLFELFYRQLRPDRPSRLFEFLALWATLGMLAACGWAISRYKTS